MKLGEVVLEAEAVLTVEEDNEEEEQELKGVVVELEDEITVEEEGFLDKLVDGGRGDGIGDAALEGAISFWAVGEKRKLEKGRKDKFDGC